MRVMLSGGGTGGHIYPALSIAEVLRSQLEDVTVLYVGTADGLEADIVPKKGLDFATITVQGLIGKSPLQLLAGSAKLVRGLYQAGVLLRRFRPDAVVGTGGYVSGPPLLVAALAGVPTLIQEQNVYPGVTNRLLSRLVNYVAVPHKEAARYFPDRARLVVTGNPVRPEIAAATKEEALLRFGADPEKPQVLCVGGSRGAKQVNEAVLKALPRLLNEGACEITWVTGQRYYHQIKEQLENSGIDPGGWGKLRLESYLYDLHLAYALADLFVGRAGAMTLAELTLLGIPAVLIPSPNVTHDHQHYNAGVLEQEGAAVVIDEEALTGELLRRRLTELIESPQTLASMAEKSRKQGHPAAAQRIVELVREMATA